jgi:hypothetical protein
MAILAGARDIAQIARFATRLHPQQRSALGLPPKPGTRRGDVPLLVEIGVIQHWV